MIIWHFLMIRIMGFRLTVTEIRGGRIWSSTFLATPTAPVRRGSRRGVVHWILAAGRLLFRAGVRAAAEISAGNWAISRNGFDDFLVLRIGGRRNRYQVCWVGMVTWDIGLVPYDSLVVVVAVPTIFDIVLVISRFFTQKPSTLSASHMKGLFTTAFVALHAGSWRGLAFAAILFA